MVNERTPIMKPWDISRFKETSTFESIERLTAASTGLIQTSAVWKERILPHARLSPLL